MILSNFFSAMVRRKRFNPLPRPPTPSPPTWLDIFKSIPHSENPYIWDCTSAFGAMFQMRDINQPLESCNVGYQMLRRGVFKYNLVARDPIPSSDPMDAGIGLGYIGHLDGTFDSRDKIEFVHAGSGEPYKPSKK